MEIGKLCERYNKSFILSENKNLKDLEPYGFKPTYDENTGELIKETLWVEGGIYGDRPIMEITNREMEQDIFSENTTIYNPLKSFIMNFHNWWYGKYATHNRNNQALDIEIRSIDMVIFNVLIDLIEDGVIERRK